MAENDRLLSSLLDTNDNVRGEAEKTLRNMSIEKRAFLYLDVLANPANREVKQISSVLLRQLLTDNFAELQEKLSSEDFEFFKSQLLLGLQIEQPENLRKRVCDIASVLVINLISKDVNSEWPQFLQFLFQCANSPSPAFKDSALRIFGRVPNVFGSQESNFFEMIKQMLEQSLHPSQTYEIRVKAVETATSFVLYFKKEPEIYKNFTKLLPNILKVVTESIEKQSETMLLTYLLELTQHTPMFLESQMSVIIELCFKILKFENIWWRNSSLHLAVEILLALFETDSSVVEKHTRNYLAPFVHEMLKMLSQLKEEKNWNYIDDIIKDDCDSPNIVAETTLDRLAYKLGGVKIWPLMIQHIPAMLASHDWRYRYAAVMSVSAVSRGCYKQIEGMLPQILNGLLNFLQDQHPKVRFATCNTVGLMAADFAPILERKFHNQVIPALLYALYDYQNPMIQAHAAAALINFSEKCPKSILIRYLNLIMSKLETVLKAKFKKLVEKGTKLVLEQIVTTIASVAETVEEHFINYYDRVMPCLKCIIKYSNKDRLKTLRGKTMECISMIGLAVGPEKFRKDAWEVMDMILKTVLGRYSDMNLDDDPLTVYIILACARMWKVLGKDFQRYLPFVMDPIIRTASVKPEVVPFDIGDTLHWPFVLYERHDNFNVTLGLSDKAFACEMLVCYTSYLGEDFSEYTEEIAKLMVPLLKFYDHEGIRISAAKILPFLLESIITKGRTYVEGMWNYICPELLKAMETERETVVLLKLVQSMAQSLMNLGGDYMSKESMDQLTKVLDKLLKEHFVKSMKREDLREEEDYDEVLEEQLQDEEYRDARILSEMAVVLHALVFAHQSSFCPYFDRLAEKFGKLLAPERSPAEHQWALCVFDDIIEYTGPACVRYQTYFLPNLLRYVEDRISGVQQAAVYGCGVLGQAGGESFADFCAQALPRLIEIINAPDSKSVRNLSSTENAISAVTKILKHNSSKINVDEILPHWLSWLPVWEDLDENPHVYGYLCDLIEASHPVILGPDNSKVPNIIAIFGEAFFRQAFSLEDDIAKRILGIIRQTQKNEELFTACLQNLNFDQHQALHKALTSSA